MEISSSSLVRELLPEVSTEEMRPVEKKVGRVCWRTYIARPARVDDGYGFELTQTVQEDMECKGKYRLE